MCKFVEYWISQERDWTIKSKLLFKMKKENEAKIIVQYHLSGVVSHWKIIHGIKARLLENSVES